MEEVERANSAAVESCYRVINLLSQPQAHNNHYRNLADQTGEAVHNFKKVVSLLNSTSGHARVRKLNKIQSPFPQNIFLENPITITDHHHQYKPLQLLQFCPPLDNSPIQEVGSSLKSGLTLTLANPSLELSSHGKDRLLLDHRTPTPLPSYHFLQHLQQLKHRGDLISRSSNSGVSLNFDGSTCTQTTRSFMSSLSVDGSVGNSDRNPFNLMGSTTQSADRSSYNHKRRCSVAGEEGSVKCGGSGKCHCSKKRCSFLACLFSDSITL